MARPPRLQKLTVFLLKEGLESNNALRERDGVTGYVVPALTQAMESLFVLAPPPRTPRWAGYLGPHLATNLEGLFTSSAPAVLLINSADRLFAVTFGQGRHLLDPEALEQDFGLRVVLNTVAPDQLKSVDARTIEETTLHTRRDVSRDSSLSAFGLDVARDLVRAVTGTPQDATLAHRLTGADALGIETRAQLPELPALMTRLLSAYEATDYKQNFEFIDHLRPEKDPGRLSELNSLLIDALKTGDITDAHLAAPEVLDWLELAGFKLSTTADREPESDPRISTYRESREQELEDLTIETLKADRLIAVRVSDEGILAAWPIYRCLVYQLELSGYLYVLSGGQWFRVAVQYKNRLYSQAETIERLEGLPDADPGSTEDAYNMKAAAVIGGLCLDKKLIQADGPDRMELCDILSREGGLIHVKQRGSSSTLSHLFAQGLNSAERLLLDDNFRERARNLIQGEDPTCTDVVSAERPEPSEHEVSFVVITRSERQTPLTLPFFSVISLVNAADRLGAFGYRVSVAAVRESPANG
jgi:uncharacterized protein (TIGR04141 family)